MAKPPKYEAGSGGLRREVVGSWSHDDKSALVSEYVHISRVVRKDFIPNTPCYIDLYCGPGEVRIKDTEQVFPSTAVVCVERARRTPEAAFGQVWLNDLSTENVEACAQRVIALGQPNVVATSMPAEEAASKVLDVVNRWGFHIALLDPFNLAALPFSVLKSLAAMKRIDILVHFSTQDVQRNFTKDFATAKSDALDRFAPGWRDHIDPALRGSAAKNAVFRYWTELARRELDMKVSDSIEHVTASKNQTLYYLCLMSRADLADRFWKAVRARQGTNRDLFGGVA